MQNFKTENKTWKKKKKEKKEKHISHRNKFIIRIQSRISVYIFLVFLVAYIDFRLPFSDTVTVPQIKRDRSF